MIETTINIHIKTMEKINKISTVYNISRNRVIINLLKRVMNKDLNKFTINKCVKYQKNDSKKNWHKFHILLGVDEYEYFLDLRKLLKKSVSALIAYAVKKYFNKMINFKITDNYLFKNYVIIKEVINDVITWRLFWGYPEKMEKILSAR